MSNTPKKQLKRKRRAAGGAGKGRGTKTRKGAAGGSLVKLVSLPGSGLGPHPTESVFAQSALDRAQEVLYDAWEAPTAAARVRAAKEALALSADCADAYLLLAEHAADPAEERRLLADAVSAGARALGPRPFEEDVGHFWGLLETRPYMRARAALAEILWDQGEREAAVEHWQDLLRLNPNDNQGIRQGLVGHLLELGRDDAAAELLARYADDATSWMSYAAALLAFRREGDGPLSRAALAAALKTNRFVPAYLGGRKPMPRYLPDHHGFGDEAEAILYTADGLAAWQATPGALAWLDASR